MASQTLEQRWRARCRAYPLFDPGDYRQANPDLAAVELDDHLAFHGLWEGRVLIRPERRWGLVAALCAGVAAADPIDAADAAGALPVTGDLRVRFCLGGTAPRSLEAAERLGAALAAVGAQVAATGDQATAIEVVVDPDLAADRVSVLASPKDRYHRAVVLLTRAPGGRDFAMQLPRALASAAVIALSPETHAVFADAGVPCLWLEPPPCPAPELPPQWAATLPSAVSPAWIDRPVEVAAFGLLTERRTRAWLDMAERLSERRTFVHMPRPRPETPGPPSDDAALRRSVYARAKIALHLHADEPTALDWRSICLGPLANGALLIAEPGLAHPRFSPDLHYFEEAPRRMPALIDWLLDTPEGRLEAQRRRLAARSALARADDLFDAGLRVAAFLQAQKALLE